MARVRYTQDQSRALVESLAAKLRDAGLDDISTALTKALKSNRDVFNIADLARETVMESEEARRVPRS